jgi:hypothetical protein
MLDATHYHSNPNNALARQAGGWVKTVQPTRWGEPEPEPERVDWPVRLTPETSYKLRQAGIVGWQVACHYGKALKTVQIYTSLYRTKIKDGKVRLTAKDVAEIENYKKLKSI